MIVSLAVVTLNGVAYVKRAGDKWYEIECYMSKEDKVTEVDEVYIKTIECVLSHRLVYFINIFIIKILIKGLDKLTGESIAIVGQVYKLIQPKCYTVVSLKTLLVSLKPRS